MALVYHMMCLVYFPAVRLVPDTCVYAENFVYRLVVLAEGNQPSEGRRLHWPDLVVLLPGYYLFLNSDLLFA